MTRSGRVNAKHTSDACNILFCIKPHVDIHMCTQAIVSRFNMDLGHIVIHLLNCYYYALYVLSEAPHELYLQIAEPQQGFLSWLANFVAGWLAK